MLEVPPARSSQQIFDRYWRLDALHSFSLVKKVDQHRMLRNDGYRFPLATPKSELEKTAIRLLCGHVNYRACEKPELRKFIRNRGLALPGKSCTKQGLEKVLEKADESRSFHRFMDLPPELRERIAKYYVREFAEVLKFPSQPPLARTSKLMRNEVLPVFYGRCKIALHFERLLRMAGEEVIRKFRPCRDTFIWLTTLADGCFERLEKLVVHWGNISLHIKWVNSIRGYRFQITARGDDADEMGAGGWEDGSWLGEHGANARLRREDLFTMRTQLEKDLL